MRTLIYNTQARAKNAAKASAIRYAEKQLGINYSPNTEKRLKLNKNWLIKYTETQCVCGGLIKTLRTQSRIKSQLGMKICK